MKKTLLSLSLFLYPAFFLLAQDSTPLVVTDEVPAPETPVVPEAIVPEAPVAPAPIVPETPVVPEPVVLPNESLVDQWIRDRLEIGTRFTSISMDELKQGDSATQVGTFFGTVNELKVEEESGPTKFYLQYRIHTYGGIGLTFDELTLATRDGPSEANSDGDFGIDSTYLYVYLRYPLPYGFVPYVEFGRGSHDISFAAEPDWGRRNSIVLDDASVSATFYSIGLEYHINRNFSLNVMQRWTNYSFDAEWRNIDGRTPTAFTVNMDQSVTGFGVKYTF